MIFTIEMFPANEGDCLWIEYGDPKAPSRVLIDCGYKSTYRAVADSLRAKTFDLFVLTHVDADHVNGAIPLFDDDRVKGRFADVWFNDRRHIEDVMGGMQGEYFAHVLKKKKIMWNQAFSGKAAIVDPAFEPIELPGGLKVTLLSPYRSQLAALSKVWKAQVDATLKRYKRTMDEQLEAMPRQYQADTLGRDVNVLALAKTEFEKHADKEPANGSSIAFLAEYDVAPARTKAALFTGDAFAPVLTRSIKALLKKRGRETLELDAFKVSHHGSRGNTSLDLLELVKCKRFLVSTNGSRHDHPNDECIARIIHTQSRPKLYFNYRHDSNEVWASPARQKKHKYKAIYPPDPDSGRLLVTL